jgi:hypothetical protein
MKTNKQWYSYQEYGSYYKLEDGELYQCPMNLDGSRADTPTWVDFDFSVESPNAPLLRTIMQELKLKD